MVRVVVFDFDGTLADTNGIKEDCLRRTVAALPRGAEALNSARRAGGDRYRIFDHVARRLWPDAGGQGIDARARALVQSYSDCCTKGIVAAAERRGARAALDTLRRRGVRLYVLSATPDRHLREVLRRRRLLLRLDGVLGSAVTKEQGLLSIMRKERVARSSILLVGDSPDDQRAAAFAGVKFVTVIAERRVERRGRFALRDLRPLVPLIDSLNSGRNITCRVN